MREVCLGACSVEGDWACGASRSAGGAGWAESSLLETYGGMLRSRVGEVDAIWTGVRAEGASARVICCACSDVPRNACGAMPRKKMARAMGTSCLDD